MLDEMTKARLHTIMAHALEHAEEAAADGDEHDACHWMKAAMLADKICRKHWMLEMAEKNPAMMNRV